MKDSIFARSQARQSATTLRSGPYGSSAPRPEKAILSFVEFKAQHAAHGTDFEPTNYNPALEQFPNDNWYTLEHDQITADINHMCTRLLNNLRTRSPDDTEVCNLATALLSASSIPRTTAIYAAFLGEQGIGKSSLVNAIFGRDFVRVSGSSSACTAYPTVIVYKDGAEDDAVESDVLVEIMGDEEVREFSCEQGRRYRGAYPRWGAEQGEHESGGESEDESKGGGMGDDDEVEFEEDDEVEFEDDDMSYTSSTENDCPNAVSPAALRAAKTARCFFELLFHTEDIEERQTALDRVLDEFDLESERFLDLCVQVATRRKESIGAQDGSLHYAAVSDETLATIQDRADEIWPLVKSVRIATGHVLLRNNVYILDLPGYGDDNHIRTAQIDKFRDMANFEIVVAPTSRVVSSVLQERYLDRSIRRLGAQNTLLVTNKSDSPLTSIRKQIKTLENAPFPQLQKRFTTVEALSRQKTEKESVVRAYREYLLKEARAAYIENEVRIIRDGLQKKSVEIVAVSARQYSLCLDVEYEDEKPILTPEVTGVPALRRYLFGLPSQRNYRTLHYHVFETLPDIVAQVQRILQKVDDNDGHATKMRETLAKQLPLLRKRLAQLTSSLPADKVARPFDGAKSEISSGLKSAVEKLPSTMYHGTFFKMLRENGMPLNGRGRGTNFNQTVLNEMVGFIETWHGKMQSRAEDVAIRLDEPIQAVLKEARKHVDGYDGDSELKRRASELLDNATRRIGMAYGKTVAQLQSTLHATYFRYSNEDNIHCPVALEMKRIYQSVLQYWLDEPGKGSYARSRAHMLKCLRTPSSPSLPFPEAMEQKIVAAQTASWKHCCEQYVHDATTLLQAFQRSTTELLHNGALLPSTHRRVRTHLHTELTLFETRLAHVKRQFDATEPLRAFTPLSTPRNSSVRPATPRPASNKRKADDGERAAAQFLAPRAADAKRVKTELRDASAQLMGLVRLRRLTGVERMQKPVIKRELGP